MRIRKHAKISPLLYAASSLKPAAILQTHLCQLNQSPWDVIAFSPPSSPPPPPPPPPSFQVNGSDVGAGNGSSGHCASVSERELSSQRLRLSDQDAAAPPQHPPPPPVEDEATILCCKTDGKSWQCRREAAKGNSLCEHHLSLARNYGNVVAKKPVKAPRHKRAPAASSPSNPYEFYYYSGFGPRWSKRRGETRKNSSNSASSMPKNAHMEPAAISVIDDEDFDFVEYEDDDDEEEEESRDNGKKRVRKPIKARSLKSLL